MPGITPDEIVREFGSRRVPADTSKAVMIAVSNIRNIFYIS